VPANEACPKMNMALGLNATPSEVCAGEMVQLTPSMGGGSPAQFSYAWSVNGQPVGPDLRQKLEQLRAGDPLSLRVRGQNGERELRWRVGARERIDFELADLGQPTAEQKARRGAWLRGESPSSAEAHP
jgi:predicted metalloprotease with PDZ domain